MTSILITGLVLEIGARIWLNVLATPEQYAEYVLFTDLRPEQYQLTKHHYLNYYPTPNYHQGLTSHNSLGFRNQEFPAQKSSGVYRIAVLGGSATYTIKVKDNRKAFPAQLENFLNTHYGYKQVEVINAGTPGYTSWESLINLEFRVLDLEPDLVIIYHAINDVHARLVLPEAYRGDSSGYRQQWMPPRIPLIEHSCLLRICLRRLGLLHQVNLNIFVGTDTFRGPGTLQATDEQLFTLLRQNPPVYFRRNLINMIAIAQAQHITIMLATWAYSPYFQSPYTTPPYRQGIQEHNAVIKDVARTDHVPCFDFAALMPQDQQYWADESHVNEQGALVQAELFAKFIHESGFIPSAR